MTRPVGRRGRIHRLFAVLLAATVLAALPGAVTAADRQAAAAARLQDIVEKLRDADHVHPDGSPHRHDAMASLTADELRTIGVRRGSGACSGMYELADDSPGVGCTHGLDVSVPTDAAAALTADCTYPLCDYPVPAGWTVPTQIPCYSTGPFVEVLYLYWGTSRLPSYVEKIRRSIASIDLLFKISAAAVTNASGTPGNRHVRWAMASGCKLKVTGVKLPSSVSSSIVAIKNNLASRGVLKSTAKYLGYVDLGSCAGGIAELPQSSIPGATNPANDGGTLGLTYGNCFEDYHPYAGFGATIAGHELMHTLGGVQANAPRSTAGHCWDDAASPHLGADIMCYDDGGVPASKFYQRCPQTYPETFDCGKDDYYNPYPTSGSYLQKYWNPARNRFLSTAEPPAWDLIGKPKVSFTKPSVTGGTVGGDAPAVVQVAAGGLAVGSVAWTVNGASVTGDIETLELETAKTRTGGYANGVQLSLAATVEDEGLLTGKATTKAIVANPWIRLTAPTEWADTSGTTNWSATALAYGGKTVTKVELLVDGVVRATDFISPFAGTFTPVDLGSAGSAAYEVAARVTDSAGITRTTPTRVVNRPAPTIVWRAPATEWDGWSQEFPYPAIAGSTVKFQVDATTTAPGGVSRVLFRVNGQTVGNPDYSAPYTFDYVVPASGAAVITARAVDQRGIYDTTPNGVWVGATTAPGTFDFTEPAEHAAISGTRSFGLSITPAGGAIYDNACLFIDLSWAGCLDPEVTDTLDVDVAALRPGNHVAHWEIGSLINEERINIHGPFRRVVVTGTSPTISITQLTPGLRVSGKRTVGAIVAGLPSGVQVNAVRFLEGGYELGSDFAAAYYLTWDTRTFGDGPRTVRALAELSDGSTLSATVDVVVVNASARLTAPLAGPVSGTVPIHGNGSYDSETAMESAVFFVDGAILTTDRFAPFSTNWNTTTATNGAHNLSMRLTFNDGRSITTAPTAVTVANP